MVGAIVLAAEIAAILAFIELSLRLRTRLTARAGGSLVLRLGLKIGGAVAAVLLVPLAADEWWTEK